MKIEHRATFAFATALMVIAPGAARAQADFTGAGEESELDCGGGAATITGAENRLQISGGCTTLSVQGAGNVISVDMAAKSAIHVTGAGNEIRWIAPGQAKPRLHIVGAGNKISRQK